MRAIRGDPQADGLLMITYFFASDAIATIPAMASLIMDSELSEPPSQVLFTFILAVVVNIVGAFFFEGLQSMFGCSAKSLLIACYIILGLCCLAGGLGAITAIPMGMYLVNAPMCLVFTAVQSYQRSIYACLIPKGRESTYFAFYEIFDKGSNFVGPLVTIVVHNLTKNYGHVFWYLLFAFILSIVAVSFVDVDEGMIDAGKHDESESESEADSLS